MSDINIPDSLPSWIKEHVELYLKDGEAGHMWDAATSGGSGVYSTLLLTTEGRKSGKRVTLPLIYRPVGDSGYCIIASKAGSPTHPAWYLNLMANPEVDVQVAADKFVAVARIAEGDERSRLWDEMADYFPNYKQYQAVADREIPVVVLDKKEP